MMIFILCFLVWYAIGAVSWTLWWVEEYDFTVSEISMTMIAGLAGPVCLIVLLIEKHKDLTLIKKRKRRR